MSVDINSIRAAERMLEGQVVRTPSIPSHRLSELTGVSIVLKLENLQHAGSFKVRGAYVKLTSLSESERRAGIVAASAGNHAQGVAFHARRLRIPATVVMPRNTPFTKVRRTEALGASVILDGSDIAEARETALGIGADKGMPFVPPYDDERIISGQGTVGLEMLADDPGLDCLVVPIGGGGLIAGIAIAAKALKPSISIIGVEAALYPSMHCAIHNQPASFRGGATVAEGIAVKDPGLLTRPVVEALVDDILIVDEGALEAAVHAFLEAQHLVVEGAGAAPLAAVTTNPERFQGKAVGFVVSGGNIDSLLLSSILMRGLARDGRLVSLRVELVDVPGALARISGVIGELGGNIVEIYHRRLFYDVPVKLAELDVLVETQNPEHVRRMVERLGEKGFPTRLLAGTLGPDTA